MGSISIVYASGSGHTEYVVGVISAFLNSKAPGSQVSIVRADAAKPEDLLAGDLLLLASGTWNTGGMEGQLQPHMHEFLLKRAKDVELGGKNVAVLALGDERYYYTARAGEHLKSFVLTHGGKLFGEPLTIVNEPYGQEKKVEEWVEKFLVPRS